MNPKKRSTAILLACLTVFVMCASVYALAETRLLGDVNNNGKIDSADYAMIKRAVLNTYELDESQKLVADTNGNGKVDASDYAMTKRAVLRTYELTGEVEVSDEELSTEPSEPDESSEPEEEIVYSSEGLAFELDWGGESYILSGIGECDSPYILVPAEYEGKPVSGVMAAAIEDCDTVKRVRFAEGIAEIGTNYYGGVFRNCKNLEYVELPEGIGCISFCMFDGCEKLKSVNIPESVTDIAYGAFNGCSRLARADIPSKVESIGDYAFKGTAIESIHIPAATQYINGNIVESCSELETITVDEDNENYSAKGNCLIRDEFSELKSGCKNSVIPDDGSVEYIGYNAFAGLTGLTSIVIPDSVTNISACAFEGCSALASVEISDRGIVVGQAAFSGTAFINDESNYESGVLYLGRTLIIVSDDVPKDLVIKDGTEYIAAQALYGKEFDSIRFPASVIHIEDYGNSSAGKIYVEDIAAWCGIDFRGAPLYNADLYLNDVLVTDLVIPDGVESVPGYAFRGC